MNCITKSVHFEKYNKKIYVKLFIVEFLQLTNKLIYK